MIIKVMPISDFVSMAEVMKDIISILTEAKKDAELTGGIKVDNYKGKYVHLQIKYTEEIYNETKT